MAETARPLDIPAAGAQESTPRKPISWGKIISYAILIIGLIQALLPFYWMVSSAIKNDTQVYTVPPVLWPDPQFWNNFWDAWSSANFNLFTFNTVVRYAIPATVGTVFSSAMVAYSFSRIRWIGRDTVFALVLATLMIPGQLPGAKGRVELKLPAAATITLPRPRASLIASR